jgi:[acyl-carrier-protein] S-malonyltransferase
MERIALLFPGQGSQYVGMGKKLCEDHAEAREVFAEAGETLQIDLQKLCFAGDAEELTKTENAQPAILTASIAAFRVYKKEIGIEPVFAAGHSLGEYSALTAAGGIRFADCLRIVAARGRFMRDAVAPGVGLMLAVTWVVGDSPTTGVAAEIVEECRRKLSAMGHEVYVSNYNAPLQTVISGGKDAVEKAGEELRAKGANIIPLKVSAPFHSPLMQPAADKLGGALAGCEFHPLAWPVIANVDALPYKDQAEIAGKLKAQAVSPVRWRETMLYLSGHGAATVVEIGPGTVLKKLAESNVPGINAFAYDTPGDAEALKRAVAAAAKNSPTVVIKCLAIAVCTRNRNWDEDEYQKGVVEPYRKIQAMQDGIEKEQRAPRVEEMRAAMEMLVSVFATKKVPEPERRERFEEIFNATGTRGLFPDFAPGEQGAM